jgi:hypothetical protein
MVTVTSCEVISITMESDLEFEGSNAVAELDYTIF